MTDPSQELASEALKIGTATSTWLFEYELGRIWQFAKMTEEFLAKEKAALEVAVEQRAAGMSEDARDHLYEHYSEEWHQLESEFPRTLRCALVVATYSELESFLVQRAASLGRHKGLNLTPRDLADKGIFGARSYYKKVLMKAFPEDTPAWRAILDLNKVRNCIVHSAGQVADDNTKLHEIVKGNGHLKLNHLGEIEPDGQYVFDVLETLKQFAQLLSALDGPKKP